MPIYEYACSGCGNRFEQLIRSRREEREVRCPECNGKRVSRQFSVIAAPRAASKPARAGPCGQCGNAGGSCPYQQG